MHGIDTSAYAYGLWTLVIFNVLLLGLPDSVGAMTARHVITKGILLAG